VLFYAGGFARFDDDRLRPALVTHALFIAECAARGFRRYDLLTGADSCKRELTVSEHSLIWARVRRRKARLLDRGARNGRP
jgi:hypothetical protein